MSAITVYVRLDAMVGQSCAVETALDDRIDSVEVGKFADFFVLGGRPT